MTWSIFFNRKKSSAVGGKMYDYDDKDAESHEQEKGILFEGQKCYRMDYCVQIGTHVFSRSKQADPYAFIGKIESFTTEREWSKDSPALYRLICHNDANITICSNVHKDHIGSPYKYKKAAWEALNLKTPVYKNFSCGMFDHDEDFKLQDHPLRKANKHENLLETIKTLEDTIESLKEKLVIN